MSFGPLVTAGWLREHIGDDNVQVVDFRWYLKGRNGREEYLKGHLPGAVFVDLDEVSGAEGSGRHPLPTDEQFQAAMRGAGMRKDSMVVVYDDAGGSVAARLWFLLGYFGHHARAVLDGGIQAWGEPLTSAVPAVSPGDFEATAADTSLVLDYVGVRALRDVPIIDARAGARYRGETEPIDPKAGHVPGALSAPYTDNLAADGRFKSAEELRAQYVRLGAENGAVFYCGSGVNSTHHLIGMALAGFPGARLYAGSWSDWSRRDAPVATGPEP
ncbi:MAG TPA: sulfurtransferase [Candidatus Dormibacteraeota bacterium]|nr:sulfurtransferase [Candidatus Dormibacteraeota bacterium]